MVTTTFKDRMVDGVRGLSIVDIPIYIPTDLTGLLKPIDFQSTSEIDAVRHAIWHTGETNDIMTLNALRETNGDPPPPHAHIICSIRTKCEAELPGLDEKILRLFNRIVDLSQQLAEVSAEAIQKRYLSNVCSSFFSPVRKLPSEILGEIFFHCIPLDDRPSIAKAPLSLSHVCSAWRKTVLALPRLWSSLFLVTAPSDTYTTLDSISALNGTELMKLWFNRTQNCPLTLKLQDYHYSVDDQILDRTIVTYAHRFQKLHLHTKSIYDLRRFLALPSGHLKWLQSLHLRVPRFQDPDRIVSVFQEAPLLRELTLDLRGDSLPNWDLPWAQLTYINLAESAIFTSEWLLVLKKCKDLVHGLFFIIPNGGNGQSVDDGPYTLENLIELKLTLRKSRESFDVLDNISLPALTKLLLDGDDETTLDDPLINFLKRAHGLQYLSLERFYTTPDNVLTVLQSTLYLTRLNLNIGFLDRQYEPLIQALTYVEGQHRTYVPSLEYMDLYLSIHEGFQFAEHAFVAMIKSRQAPKGSLPPPRVAFLYVCLKISSYEVNPVLSIIQSAKDAGETDIKIQY